MMRPFWRSLMEIARAVGQMRDGVDPKQPDKRKRSPAATAVPTATASLPLTFLRWSQEVERQTEILEDAAQTTIGLMEHPMLGDATWNALLDAQMVKRREVDAALREIVPPDEYREAHAMLLSSTGDGLLGAEYTLKGIQQLDPDLWEQGLEYSESATAKINLFRLMLESMTP